MHLVLVGPFPLLRLWKDQLRSSGPGAPVEFRLDFRLRYRTTGKQLRAEKASSPGDLLVVRFHPPGLGLRVEVTSLP